MNFHTSFTLRLAALLGVCLMSCDDDKEEQIDASFAETTFNVSEDNKISVRINLNKPASRTAYVSVVVSSANATFGSDYGVDNLIFLNDGFSVKIPKDSTGASFTFKALADFDKEADESVSFTLTQTSDGLSIATPATATVIVKDVEKHPDGNRAIAFDGQDDFIDLGNIFDDVSLPVTISVWVWIDPNVPNGSLPIFDSQDGLPSYNGFSLITSNISHIGIQYGDGRGENSSEYRRAKSAEFEPVTGRWVNMTGVMRSATDMSVYLNGVEMAGTYAGESNFPLKSMSPSENAKVGTLSNNGRTLYFKGKLDELRIWNRALTAEDIQKSMITRLDKTAPGLIGYWDFNEATGSTVLDHSKNNFSGVIKGGATRVDSTAPVE